MIDGFSAKTLHQKPNISKSLGLFNEKAEGA